MQGSKAARRYAKALYALARDREVLGPVREDVAALLQLCGTCQDFSRFITNPVIPRHQRSSILETMFEPSAHPLTLRFLVFLDSKDRLDSLEDVCSVFIDLYQKEHKILPVNIVSAFSLNEDHIQRICDTFKQKFSKTIQHTTQVDPSLIGGFKVRVEDTIYDYSIHTQLEVLREKLLHA